MSSAPPKRPVEDSEFDSPTLAEVGRKLATDIPYGVTVATGWALQFIIIVVAAGIGIWLFSHVSLLVVPLLIAALLSSLLYPVHSFLKNRFRFPAWLSVVTVMLGFLSLIVGLLWLAGQQLAVGFADMWQQIQEGIVGLFALAESYGLTTDRWQEILADVWKTFTQNSDAFVSGAIGFGSTATNIGAGTLIALFALIFFLIDGSRIWNFMLNFVPRRHRRAIDGAGHAGWKSLGSYVRVQIFVAFVDAVGIGLGAWLLSVPLALPLAVLVFLGSFIPMIGAVLTGAIAVILALVANGWVNALLMLVVVLIVQQAESHILQPLVMGRAVQLHPLVVFLAVSGGTALMGIVGAIFAVPAIAFANSFVKYLSARPWEKNKDPHAVDPEAPDEMAPSAGDL